MLIALERGYLRRVRWEARVLADALLQTTGRHVAAAVPVTLEQARPGQSVRGASGTIYKVIGANAMIAQLGG